jgi:NAD(P)-dependent dehydrogenase (short-subunit alcohol dehydrogenase family)
MNHTSIITGANRGLGYETALALAQDTSRAVVLAGRDMEALRDAARSIQSQTGNGHLLPMELDLASLASVRAFTNDFRARADRGDLPPLQSIICNAGISRDDRDARSVDGYELMFAVNHLGHFLLVHRLLDCLQPPARIIFVSSSRHDPDQAGRRLLPPRYVKAEWLAYPERDPGYTEEGETAVDAYGTTKLCNLLCAYELDRRLQDSALSTPARPITVNAFNPGLIAGTGLGRNARGFTRLMWYYILPWLSRLMGFGRSARQSGEDLAHLATAPELTGVSGQYFDGRETKRSSDASYDLDKAADLWRTSVELCRLQSDESPLAS